MIDLPTQHLLQDIVSRESRSLLMYIGAAFPWVSKGGESGMTTLMQLIKDESAALHALGRFLARRRIPPPPAKSFPSAYTSLNFISLKTLLPRLVEAQKESILALEKDLPSLASAEGRAEVEKLLNVKKRTLAGLLTLANPSATAAGA